MAKPLGAKRGGAEVDPLARRLPAIKPLVQVHRLRDGPREAVGAGVGLRVDLKASRTHTPSHDTNQSAKTCN